MKALKQSKFHPFSPSQKEGTFTYTLGLILSQKFSLVLREYVSSLGTHLGKINLGKNRCIVDLSARDRLLLGVDKKSLSIIEHIFTLKKDYISSKAQSVENFSKIVLSSIEQACLAFGINKEYSYKYSYDGRFISEEEKKREWEALHFSFDYHGISIDIVLYFEQDFFLNLSLY